MGISWNDPDSLLVPRYMRLRETKIDLFETWIPFSFKNDIYSCNKFLYASKLIQYVFYIGLTMHICFKQMHPISLRLKYKMPNPCLRIVEQDNLQPTGRCMLISL